MGKKVFFLTDHTLHTKVTIPLALHFLKEGWQVTYKMNTPHFMGFPDFLRRRYPTRVAIINRSALRYVAATIQYHREWKEDEHRISYSFRIPKEGIIIGTTKDIPQLSALARQRKDPVFALGYQHLPIIMKVASPSERSEESPLILFGDKNHPFSIQHKFSEILSHGTWIPCGFAYLDKVFSCHPESANNKLNTVIVLHPGGYRNILTPQGASKRESYERQYQWLERVCLPLIKAGFKPIIKIHPLAARYHTTADILKLIHQLQQCHSLLQRSILVASQTDWSLYFQSQFILSFGSASIYELWSMGLENIFVAQFEGITRSQKFTLFPEIGINTYEDYLNFLKQRKWEKIERTPLLNTTISQYSSLFTGQATKRGAEFIINVAF